MKVFEKLFDLVFIRESFPFKVFSSSLKTKVIIDARAGDYSWWSKTPTVGGLALS